MDEAEYDMMDYHANVDRSVDFMGAEVESVGNHDVDTSDDLLDDENLSYESFDSLTDEEMEDFETRRSLKLRELRRKKRGGQSTSQVTFYVGQLFPTANAAKDKINKHAIETRRSLSFLRNDKKGIRVVCEGRCPIFTCGPNQTGPSQSGPGIHIQSATCQKGKESSASGTKKGFKKGLVECNDKRKGRLNSVDCPWVLYLSRLSDEDETWVVKTYQPDHKCLTSRKIQPFTSTFLAKKEFVMNQIAANPNISVSRLQEELGRKYELSVTKMKTFRTKLKATKKIEGDFKVQYASLRDYVMELHRTNPGTTVKFVVEPECNPHAPTRIFKRIYVCLGPLKEGFKECRRELLGLDGAFMKGPYPGQMLTAVGLDPNNGIYPLAYGIVEAENKGSWIWFLQCIKDDLDLPDHANFTFIPDRQKGIIPAITQVFPAAEHRFCVRHIWQNMKLQWRGVAFKDCL
ncbi:putative transposase, mutator type, transposase, MuDR, plant, MULE transposase [Helianthus annuus]|uniref:Transposase, mutator type, transposase, MuDR, plant, MULE transposase n=3 Tax=Helianthus annuus TaxID=4232 RepID=A0A9K3DT18_HELAN|nr:putative transposase, mutator type, transposase, MuDR, plant, MULE transposase [Helianthus annuus]KAJ0443019.1 putative transposase, mutator type, transposase, MuDR, plant, MULE transposase [Helianthus annuus]KAJ0821399.1 putative transposase, mutator type, transposase, MuDR, plant, MULE transposase [Helianthus annuus]KAJ0836080.1 putative transposase, mutator type, transposase, MuDR, plant, MULE transposase [Helianthus annuus]